MKKIIFCLVALGLLGFAMKTEKEKSEQELKAEIENAEKAFNDFAASKGIAQAFYAFAAEDAIIKRENDTLIKGRDNIRKYYSNPKLKNASVTWKPDFVSVSKDGTLGYTYGKYVWTAKDSTGKATDYKGVFHTVWKRQSDGSWKYVWD